MEGRLPRRAIERRPHQLLFHLERNNTTVHSRQSVQLSAAEQIKRRSWPPASGPAGRPSIATLHRHRTVMWMELSLLRPLYSVREGARHTDRQTLRKLPKHYGAPERIISIIRNPHSRMACSVVCQLTGAFQKQIEVRQACQRYAFYSCWSSTECLRHPQSRGDIGVKCTQVNYLAFQSHTYQKTQEKTSTVADNPPHLGLIQ